MTRRRRPREVAHLEPPDWYGVFDAAAWDEPDGHERAMMDGCSGRAWPDSPDSAWPGWPEFLHVQHARRRWNEARYAYSHANPAFAEQEYADLLARSAERRRGV